MVISPEGLSFSRVSNFIVPAKFISASHSCRHVRYSLEDRSDHCIDRVFGQDCESVGNGGCSKTVSFSSLSSGDIGGSALTSDSSAGAAGAVRGGKGVPAESTREGMVRSIGGG